MSNADQYAVYKQTKTPFLSQVKMKVLGCLEHFLNHVNVIIPEF